MTEEPSPTPDDDATEAAEAGNPDAGHDGSTEAAAYVEEDSPPAPDDFTEGT
jgi:hypothetical protein